MGNIVRWFEDFPSRALQLLPEMKELASQRDRIGSLSLLIAPALIVAPYERLQTHKPRKNPQRDYSRFVHHRKRFDAVMKTPFGEAEFWMAKTTRGSADWLASEVSQVTADPSDWKTREGRRPCQKDFWLVDIKSKETRWVWELLRDSLSHWNVACADEHHSVFDEGGIMKRLLFYRSHKDSGPWDVISVSTNAFLDFLEGWTTLLSQGFVLEMLAASEAA